MAGVDSRACKAFRHLQRQGIQEHRQGEVIQNVQASRQSKAGRVQAWQGQE